MKLQRLNKVHFEALHKFEMSNKDWFERFVPPRPDSYGSFLSFQSATEQLLLEQQRGESYFFVGSVHDSIIVRANLVDVNCGTADVGYRVSSEATGKGYATKALKQLVEFARDQLNLTQLTAKTTCNNQASIKVLGKVGFTQLSRDSSTFLFNGESVTFVHFTMNLAEC
jgi:ribosomal-protein-alanine N-acetyltransferase